MSAGKGGRRMRSLKTGCRWFAILLCLGALISYGLFSVSGIVGAVVAVLLLPVTPVRSLWRKILPPDAPRFAKEAILTAAFLLMMAAAPPPSSGSLKPIPTPMQSVTAKTEASAPVPTALPVPTPAPTEVLQAEELPEAEAALETAGGTAQSDTVYIAGSGQGTKYHSTPNCSSMKDPVALTRAEAENRGYTPCKRCCN